MSLEEKEECSWCNGTGYTDSSLGSAFIISMVFGGIIGFLIGYVAGKGWF